MHTASMIRTAALLLCLACSACMSMQHQLDRHERDLTQLRGQLAHLQANSHSEIEQLRGEVQALNGSIEEKTVVHDREIKALQARLDSMTTAAAHQGSPQAPFDGMAASAPQNSIATEQALYDRALQSYYSRNYEQSRSLFHDFAKQYPTGTLTQNALFWIGMCLFQEQSYQASIAALEDLIKKFPQSAKVPDAYYWQAMSFIELKEKLTAQILLETLMQSYPDAEASHKAQAKYEELTAGQPR